MGKTSQGPVLEASGLTKHFGGITALSGVDLTLYSGQVLGLVGDNGAGKSTLVKILSGVHTPDEGTISVGGVELNISNPGSARAHGIETVYQHLALVEELDVAGNLFLGRETLISGPFGRLLGLLNKRSMFEQSEKVIDNLQVRLPNMRAPVRTLSGGQRQAVAIGRTVLWGRRVLILDEPTAALGVREAGQVLELIEHLSSEGLPMIVVSHNVEHVFRVCHRIVVLRHGKKVFDNTPTSTNPQELVAYITGALV